MSDSLKDVINGSTDLLDGYIAYLLAPSNEPENSHQVASSSTLHSYQAGQSQSFQDTGQSPASNQHGGRRKGRKRKGPSGEGDGTKLNSISADCALTEIKNLLDQVSRRKCKLDTLKICHLCIHTGIKIAKEAKAENKNDDLILPWEEPPYSEKLMIFDSELKGIRKQCQTLKTTHSGVEIPDKLAQHLKQIRMELETIMSHLNQEYKVNELATLVAEKDIDTKTLREKLHSLCPQWFNQYQACAEQDSVDGDELTKHKKISGEQTDGICNEQADWGTAELACIDAQMAKLGSQEEKLRENMEDIGKQKAMLQDHRIRVMKQMDALALAKIKNILGI